MLFLLSPIATELLCHSFEYELSTTVGRWNIPMLILLIQKRYYYEKFEKSIQSQYENH